MLLWATQAGTVVMSPEIQSERPWETIPRWPRRVLSAWLLFHVIAISLPPLSMPPTSSLVNDAARIIRPYVQLFYLNHGYHYFAPQPGESTLIEFTATRQDGSTLTGIMPHRRIWPRLLYHRHFMLTESLRIVPEELEDEWLKSYARCISRKTHCPKVELTVVLHDLPTMDMVREGVTLDHPDGFYRTPLGVYERTTERQVDQSLTSH